MFFVPRTVDMVVRIAFVVVAHKNSTIDRYTSKKRSFQSRDERAAHTVNTEYTKHSYVKSFFLVCFVLFAQIK